MPPDTVQPHPTLGPVGEDEKDGTGYGLPTPLTADLPPAAPNALPGPG